MTQDALDQIQSFRAMACRDPSNPELHYQLGFALHQRGDLEGAIDSYKTTLRLRPDDIPAKSNLGVALANTGQPDKAVQLLGEVLATNPDATEVRVQLAIAQEILGRYNDAISHYNIVLQHDVNHVTANIQMGLISINRDANTTNAISCFRNALLRDPTNIDAIAGMAKVYARNGNADKAYDILKPFLNENTGTASTSLVFADVCRHFDQCPLAITLLEGILAKATSPPPIKRSICFALGRLYDASGAYDQAFPYFERANAAKPVAFSARETAADFDRMIAAFDTDTMTRLPRAYKNTTMANPVFVVGMPRSGTTLLEQILASHTSVIGLGERRDIANIIQNLSNYPECISTLNAAGINELAGYYWAQIDPLAKDSYKIIVDKMPANFLNLGLIDCLLPNAKVIHMQRDPQDICLSCYFHEFLGNHPYAYNLENLGFYYRQYERLMRHWREVLRIPILDMRYEQLVENLDTSIKEILAFCDLDYDEQCLNFYNHTRTVVTSSFDQVRRPIYHTSIGRWRHYGRYLTSLKQALEEN